MVHSDHLIYSPDEHIPIGEPVILPNGGHGIRFKRKRRNGYAFEVVTLDKLHELVVQGNNKTSEQRSR